MRVEALQLKLEFREKIDEIKPSIITMETAIDELLGCDEISELFHVALIAGNIINGVCMSMGYVRQWGVYINGVWVHTSMGYVRQWGAYVNGVCTSVGYVH